jgi:hypothetical protein
MANDNLQEPLQALPAMLNHVIAKPVREHLPRQRRDRHARALALEDVAEVFEVAVAAPHAAVAQLEGGDVGAAEDLVVGVHAAADAVGAGVFDLEGRRLVGGLWPGEKEVWGREGGRKGGDGRVEGDVMYLYLEEVLGWAVDLLEALLARIWHGLHGCKDGAQGRKQYGRGRLLFELL